MAARLCRVCEFTSISSIAYSVTYGSLGAVIILLTWFYLTGLMLLLGAEINSEIEAAAAERRVIALSSPGPVARVAD